ncbi:MAG: serine protease [Actinobacteria bacterium]|nr:MAG: serine protease [Actinomycetota bacterium]TML77952.1 MAG: serine protease [Actinomycetota bacterium]
MAVLEEVTGSVRAVVDRVGPAVVGLGRGWGRGSGVVVAPGRVVTNAHNLRGDDVSVTFADGRVETGEVVGVDSDGDLAVIAVETGDAEPVEIAGDASLATGSVVFALANPGGRGLRATLGLVSTTERSFRGPRGRRFRGAIEHTAPLPRGSSGGPLVDEAGRLLGINTVRLDGGLIVAIAADQGFAERVETLARGEALPRPRLGLAIAPARVARRLRRAVGLPERDGLLVHGVERDGPAARAGVEKGDLLVRAGDRDLLRLDDLHEALDAVAAGGELRLTAVRGVDEREVVARLGGGEEA